MLRKIPKRCLVNVASSCFTTSSAASTPPSPTLSSSNPRNFAKDRQHSPADGFYWSSAYGSITVPDMTLDSYVWQNLAKWPNKIAMVCGLTGRQYTYAQLRDHCAAVAHRLRSEYGLRRGDVIAVSMPNEPEFAIAVLGAMEAGLAVTTINPAYTTHEHANQLIISRAKLIFGVVEGLQTLRSSVALVTAEVKQTTAMPIVVLRTNREELLPTGVRDFAELMNVEDIDWSSLSPVDHQPNDVALIPFSSGTTGLAKGVQLTHRNVTANCEMLDVPLPDERLIRPTTGDHQEILPGVLPFFHIYGFTALLVSKLALGCKLVTLPRFEPITFLQMLDDHRATFLGVVPPLLLFLANDERVQQRHLSGMRMIMCAAASSGASDADRLRERTAPRDIQFIQAYGMTELSPIATISTLPNNNYDSIGRAAASVELKIVTIADEDSEAAADTTDFMGADVNVEGELLVRGPNVMLGYLNNPDATAATMAPGGWLRTGDVAAYNADGQFFIRDRVKELIKVNGYPVAPAELEELLRSHPLVLDAGVIGVKDARAGEVPRAFVSVRTGNRDGAGVTAAELQAFIAERVVRYKRLVGGVQFVAMIPRSSTGKILRRMLKQ